MSGAYRFAYRQSPDLPALAWLARIEDRQVTVSCGASVRTEERGFVEGTWIGDSDLAALPSSTTVFGSGIVAEGDAVVIVPPSHPLERLYLFRRHGSWLASNSLAWLLDAAGVELDPDVLYPPIFLAASRLVRPPLAEIPTTGHPITAAVYDNFRITPAGKLEVVSRPREEPFESFDDFRRRLTVALGSAVDNAPGYEMVVSVSSGYDSTAVAALAAPLGCRRAVTFTEGKPVQGSPSLIDSGAATAAALGMEVESFDRLAYLDRGDMPEAEFLATGMTGEDVVMATMDGSLRHRMLLTGSEEFRLKGSPYRPGLHRGDLSSTSLTEFRLRLDFVHVPILFVGASEQPSVTRIIESAEMRPYVFKGLYDKPIQRRIAEDAGIPRGSFATVKRRTSGSIHSDGLAQMSAASVDSVRAFAAAEGRHAETPKRFVVRRWHRFVLRHQRSLHIAPFVAGLEVRRRALTHLDPAFGSLLLRWAVSVVRTRYAAHAPDTQTRPIPPVDTVSSGDVTASLTEGP